MRGMRLLRSPCMQRGCPCSLRTICKDIIQRLALALVLTYVYIHSAITASISLHAHTLSIALKQVD
jgi:hypothetical protein